MNFLVVVGSTRDGRKTIHAAEAVRNSFSRSGHNAELFDLKEKNIPFLGNRSYADEGPVPEDVEELSRRVEETDCIVIVSPEYNHSIPGVLKNALDHLYPEYEDNPFTYVTTSAGGFGGVRSLSHLQDITLALGGFPGPSLQISNIGNVFENSQISENYKRKLDDFVEDTVEFTEKLI